MLEVFVGVFVVGRPRKASGITGTQDRFTQVPERSFPLSLDHMVQQGREFRTVGKAIKFRTSSDQDHPGTPAPQAPGQGFHLGAVPEVDAESHDPGLFGGHGLDHGPHWGFNQKFEDPAPGPEGAEGRPQAHEAEGRVDVPGVDSDQDDGGHGWEFILFA